MGKGRTGGRGFGIIVYLSWHWKQVSPVVQHEFLVLVSSFMRLFIPAWDKAPLFLDVVVRIVFTITGKAEKNGS